MGIIPAWLCSARDAWGCLVGKQRVQPPASAFPESGLAQGQGQDLSLASTGA